MIGSVFHQWLTLADCTSSRLTVHLSYLESAVFRRCFLATCGGGNTFSHLLVPLPSLGLPEKPTIVGCGAGRRVSEPGLWGCEERRPGNQGLLQRPFPSWAFASGELGTVTLAMDLLRSVGLGSMRLRASVGSCWPTPSLHRSHMGQVLRLLWHQEA